MIDKFCNFIIDSAKVAVFLAFVGSLFCAIQFMLLGNIATGNGYSFNQMVDKVKDLEARTKAAEDKVEELSIPHKHKFFTQEVVYDNKEPDTGESSTNE
tara:strand:+ start:2978 stop:3274 length:297 start_codon:yes stop_codon:yes gene_type:complete